VQGNLVGDTGFSQESKAVGRISLLELGLRGWVAFPAPLPPPFHSEGGVSGRQGVERKSTADSLNEREGNYYSYSGNSQVTLHIQLGSLH